MLEGFDGRIKQLVGSSHESLLGDWHGDIRHNAADISRLESAGLGPRVTLREGLQRFAAWVLTQPLPDDQLARANDELRTRGLMKQNDARL